MANEPPDHSQGTTSRYRAYLIGHNGHIENVIEIVAEDDAGAIAQARDLTRAYEVELWDRSRVVIRLPAIALR